MGVNPEPAHRADDVSRLVPCGSLADAGAFQRRATSRAGSAARLSSCGVAAAMLAGLVLLSAPRAAEARESAIATAIPALVRADLRPADAEPEWGGSALVGQDDTVSAPVARSQGAMTGTREGDEDVLRFGDMSVPRDLVATILRASETTGVDPVYMMALADKESSFDTEVKSSASSAQGLFQFVTGTWLEMIRTYGARYGLAAEAAAVKGHGGGITIADAGTRKRVLALRNDPYVSGLMAGELIKRDRARIEARIGRALKTTELYLAHFLGTASAGKFLSLSAEDPDKVAQKVFGRAARANRSIFTAKAGGKRRSLTVAEVHERLDGMIDQRMSQYQAIAELAGQSQEQEVADTPILDARLRLDGAVAPALSTRTIQ
ncbi:transglycosylase SLT domain-containing protein [Methylorubrum salsuginis]|uniref:Transglycosylase SLT domain-containing protein n=1 Tax=Methylorubrum salsuginis TaxID=414703 RepID=A0A1I3ZNP0_9HYPH|nr:transglycosylase SLT domain-containing protein [Methylorubrum salsuginis]SFK45159.1 Transglycosylase SLT domain-containing protein [Methylorubrum salsuginis]